MADSPHPSRTSSHTVRAAAWPALVLALSACLTITDKVAAAAGERPATPAPSDRSKTGEKAAEPAANVESLLGLEPAKPSEKTAAHEAQPGSSETRRSVPSREQQDSARDEIKRIFQKQFKETTTREQKLALAKELREVGQKTIDNENAQFSLFCRACELTAEAGEIERAYKVVAAIAARYAVDPLAMKADVLSRLKPSSARDRSVPVEAVARATLALIDEAVAVDNYELAKRLFSGLTFAPKSVDYAVVREVATCPRFPFSCTMFPRSHPAATRCRQGCHPRERSARRPRSTSRTVSPLLPTPGLDGQRTRVVAYPGRKIAGRNMFPWSNRFCPSFFCHQFFCQILLMERK